MTTVKRLITTGTWLDFYLGAEATVRANPLHLYGIHGHEGGSALKHDPSLGCRPDRAIEYYFPNLSQEALQCEVQKCVSQMARASGEQMLKLLSSNG